METAPARMISNAQTVAKIGRRMKKSTKSRPSSVSRGFHRGVPRNFRLADWFYGRAIDQELNTRDDDLVASLQSVHHGIIVADSIAESDRALPRDCTLVRLRCDVNKRLSSDARDRQYRNRRRRRGAPHHARSHQLLITKCIQ